MAKRKYDDSYISINENDKLSFLMIADRTCNECGTVSSKIDSNIEEFKWAEQLQCEKCNDIWTICVVCRNRPPRMKTIRFVCNHDHFCHPVKKCTNETESLCDVMQPFDNKTNEDNVTKSISFEEEKSKSLHSFMQVD